MATKVMPIVIVEYIELKIMRSQQERNEKNKENECKATYHESEMVSFEPSQLLMVTSYGMLLVTLHLKSRETVVNAHKQ